MSDAFHLAQLRHAYAHLAAGRVLPEKQREFADGLIAPAIRHFEATLPCDYDERVAPLAAIETAKET